MAADEAARRKFASNCVKLIRDYGFDGIDIDWEYPGYAPHAGTPEDTENYSLLLKDIRRALDQLGSETGKFYGLTVSLSFSLVYHGLIWVATLCNYYCSYFVIIVIFIAEIVTHLRRFRRSISCNDSGSPPLRTRSD